jgi:imidazolonepropionase-like amidohydrolase
MKLFQVRFAAILLVAWSLSCSQAPEAQQLQGPIAIIHAVILDGTGRPPLEDGTIIIDQGKILALGDSADVAIPANAREIDARGMTVMPGLADMHVHMVGGWDGVSVDLLGYQRYLNSLLYCGVTTVLDMGNVLPFSIQLRQEIDSGRIVGPRILTSGALIDGPEPYWPDISFAVTGEEQIPKFVAKLKNERVDFIKAYFGLTEEQIIRLVRESAQADLPVFIHPPQSISYEALAETGVKAIAHTPTTDLTDVAVAKMKEKDIACLTTLTVIEVVGLQRFHDKTFLQHPLVRDTTPPWFLEEIQALAPKTERPSERLKKAFLNIKRLHDAGVLLVAGTDAPYPGVFQGEGIHRELELLVEAGLTPLEAITAATRNAARLMISEDERGTLAPGKIADLLLIRGRPDRDIRESRNIQQVIKNGEILDRAALKFDPSKDPGFRTSTSIASQ